MQINKVLDRAIFRLIRLLPKRRTGQFFLVILSLIAASGCKGLVILSVGPFLAALSDSSPEATNASGSFDQIVTYLSSNAWLACLAFGVLAISAALFGVASSWAISRYTNCLSLDILEYGLKQTLNEPYIIHTKRNSSHTISDISRAQGLSSSVFAPFIQLFGSSLTVVTTLLVAFYANWRASLLAVLLGGSIYLLIAARTQRILTRDGQIIVQNDRHKTRLLREAFDGIRDVILDNSQDLIISKQIRLGQEILATNIRSGLVHSLPRYLLEGLGYLLLSGFGLFAVLSGNSANLNLATIGTLALAMQNLLPSIQQVFSCWSSYKSGKPAMNSVLGLLEADHKGLEIDKTWPKAYTQPSQRPAESVVCFKSRIELANASYIYQNCDVSEERSKTKGIDSINLCIAKQEIVGIAGKTGSGKSTLIDSIMGLLPLSSGDLKIDGESIYTNCITRQRWLSQISHVPQQIFLADQSIMQNIASQDMVEEIDFDKLEWAAAMAEATEFILELPNQWMTAIGQQGIRLSGGQRQRLGIARAIYRERPVLVLDEATSALDSYTEQKVMDNIMAMGNKPTLIMVAHRLSTLEICNRVLLLDKGKIVQQGRLDEIQKTLALRNEREEKE